MSMTNSLSITADSHNYILHLYKMWGLSREQLKKKKSLKAWVKLQNPESYTSQNATQYCPSLNLPCLVNVYIFQTHQPVFTPF